MRSGSDWSDGRILNISSRGMLVRLNRPIEPGGWIELREGAHSVSARVVWRSGFTAGIRSDAAIQVEEWLAKSETDATAASARPKIERRRVDRRHERSRTIARHIETAAVGAIAVAIALSMSAAAASTLLAPLASAEAALER